MYLDIKTQNSRDHDKNPKLIWPSILINIDKYDRKVWAEFGELYERMGRLSQALGAYNKANFLPDKDYTDKIEELKSKLESQ